MSQSQIYFFLEGMAIASRAPLGMVARAPPTAFTHSHLGKMKQEQTQTHVSLHAPERQHNATQQHNTSNTNEQGDRGLVVVAQEGRKKITNEWKQIAMQDITQSKCIQII